MYIYFYICTPRFKPKNAPQSEHELHSCSSLEDRFESHYPTSKLRHQF